MNRSNLIFLFAVGVFLLASGSANVIAQSDALDDAIGEPVLKELYPEATRFTLEAGFLTKRAATKIESLTALKLNAADRMLTINNAWRNDTLIGRALLITVETSAAGQQSLVVASQDHKIVRIRFVSTPPPWFDMELLEGLAGREIDMDWQAVRDASSSAQNADDYRLILSHIYKTMLALENTMTLEEISNLPLKPGQVRDPVCNMVLELEEVIASNDYKGTSYGFCRPKCARAFARNKRKYAELFAKKFAHERKVTAETGPDGGPKIMIDPVCRKKLTKEKSAGYVVYVGKTYYFCSSEHLAAFRGNPSDYVED